MQIRIDSGPESNRRTEIIAFVEPAPPRAPYVYTDVDGDGLAVHKAVIPDLGPGVNIITAQHGASIPLADIPALIAGIWGVAEIAAADAGIEFTRPFQPDQI